MKFNIGDLVQISDNSWFAIQGYRNRDPHKEKLIGTIIEFSTWKNFKYKVQWDYGTPYHYNDRDLILYKPKVILMLEECMGE